MHASGRQFGAQQLAEWLRGQQLATAVEQFGRGGGIRGWSFTLVKTMLCVAGPGTRAPVAMHRPCLLRAGRPCT